MISISKHHFVFSKVHQKVETKGHLARLQMIFAIYIERDCGVVIHIVSFSQNHTHTKIIPSYHGLIVLFCKGISLYNLSCIELNRYQT